MIPRTIHYCWLSNEEMPESLKRCMASWHKVMPDYELVKWDARRFDVESVPFVAEAFSARKWAFASDYIRLHALYTEGGIYLDTDVEVKKRFDPFLSFDVFTSLEYHIKLVRQANTLSLLNSDGSSKEPLTRKPGIGLQAAVIGGVKGHPFFGECLDYYRDQRFVLPDVEYFDKKIAPDIYAMVAERLGFRYLDERQLLAGNMLVMPSEIFAGGPDEATFKSYAIHYCAGSWRDDLAQPSALRRAAKRAYRILGLRAFEKWKSRLSTRS